VAIPPPQPQAYTTQASKRKKFSSPALMDDGLFPSPKALELLQLELSLLQVLHHRNKNQLHLQPFFKHLSILRRTLNLLLENVTSEYLLEKLQKTVIPHAWASFSRLVARGEFVTLALVLCASVARVASCLGGIEDLSRNTDVSEMLAFEGEEVGEIIMSTNIVKEGSRIFEETMDYEWMEPKHQSLEEVYIDRPEKLQRKDETVMSMQDTTTDETTIGEIERPGKKRRKKKVDDIDKLFAGLV
jgi:ribonuclease MRP protein subunit RMP1